MAGAKRKLPRTRAQWQEAVDLAGFWLSVQATRDYGLTTGGPEIDVARCEELLRLGRERGVVPSPGSFERLARTAAGG